MKKSLLRCTALGLSCLFASAVWAGESTQSNAQMSSQELVNYYGVEYVVDLMEKMCPEMSATIGHNKLMELTNYVAENGDENLGIAYGPLDDYGDYMIYLQQVLPLYQYLTKEREKPAMGDLTQFEIKNVATTPRDACYYGLNDPRNTYNSKGIDCEECVNSGGKLKANSSYVWGLTHMDGKLYWGTASNMLCTAGMQTMGNPSGLPNVPYENSCWTCEFANGPAADLRGAFGDIVDAQVYEYDPTTGVVRDISPDDRSFSNTQGFRSAGAHKGVVFMGGPTLDNNTGSGGANSLFAAYSSKTGELLGISDMSSVSGCKVTNVRNWLVLNDVLYCGVAITDKEGVQRGAVIRWYGDENDPFNFEIVGYMGNQAAEIVAYDNRIYIAGWPTADYPLPCVYRSPIVPEGGFTPADAVGEYEKVWGLKDAYETYMQDGTVMSAMFTYKDYLYWGTMSTPYANLTKTLAKYGSLSSPQALAYLLGTIRATTLWRMDKNGKVELLYGEEKLPVQDADGNWSIQNNKTNLKPLFGPSGYGNMTTNYTWCSAEYNGRMYVGTMDFGKLVSPALENFDLNANGDGDLVSGLMGTYITQFLEGLGADAGYEMLMIDDPEKPVKVLTRDGFGNDAAYGLRNLEVIDNTLYIGTSNPFNLLPNGGWEVLSFYDKNINGIDAVNADAIAPGFIYRYANDYIKLTSVDGSAITNVDIYDINGRLVANETPGENEAYIVTTDLVEGTYVVKTSTKTLSRSFKVVVK